MRTRATIARSTRLATVLAMALAALVGAAWAQGQRGATGQGTGQGLANPLQGFSQNRDEPVKITADKLSVRPKENVATFTGNVHVTQGDTDMRSKTLVVYYVDDSAKDTGKAAPGAPIAAAQPGPAGQQQIRRIEASGDVLVSQKDQTAKGERGTYDAVANTVTLTGSVVVMHGKDVMRGERLVVDLATGVSHIESGGGQVEGLFQQPPRDANPQANPLRALRPN
jgi:lipopolysaccharide export system protein LptA